MSIKKGDVVQFKNGAGPEMTVAKIIAPGKDPKFPDAGERAECTWKDGPIQLSYCYGTDLLQKVG